LCKNVIRWNAAINLRARGPQNRSGVRRRKKFLAKVYFLEQEEKIKKRGRRFLLRVSLALFFS
jgi:hypothetical protein